MGESKLPPILERFIRSFCRPDLVDTVLGDLEELYDRRMQSVGDFKAGLFLILDTILFIRPFLFKNFSINSNNQIMVGHDIKISWRKIQKHQFSALTKVLSISVGIVSVFFISIYIHHENSFDHFHVKRNRIYTLNTTVSSPTGDMTFGLTATGVGDYLKSIGPEIEDVVRINRAYGSHVLANGERRFIESENILYVDNSFFKVFDFEHIAGNLNESLNDPLSIVLTERSAKKYFGNTQVVGEILELDSEPYTVTGVVRDVPSNSHLQFGFLLSMDRFLDPRPSASSNWTWMPMNTFLLLNENADLSHLTNHLRHIPAYSDESSVEHYSLTLEALEGIYFSEIGKGKLGATSSMSNLYILGIVGVMILLLASFNYINLTTAVHSIQQKEVSIKKSVGASGKNVFQQTMVESVVFAIISGTISLGIILFSYRYFETFLNINYGLGYLLTPIPLSILIGIPFLLAVIGGMYPALKFSKISASLLIKKETTNNQLFDTRSGLLVFQFLVTSILMIGSAIMYFQLNFIQNQNLGFQDEGKIVIDFGPNSHIGNQYEILASELGNISGVEGVTFSSHVPGEIPNGVTTVLTDADGFNRNGDISLTLVDASYIDNYGLKIIAGRRFRAGETDITSSLIVNESCARAYGFDDPREIIGQNFSQWGGDGRIVGVVSDFNYLSLHEDVGLLSLKIWPSQFQKMTVNVSALNLSEIITGLERKWTAFYPDIPFNYYFLDENFRRQYETDQRFMLIINVFTGIAIFIGMLGLISFTSFWVDRKRREMSIRKVLGAEVSTLLWKLFRQFSLPVAVGFVFAVPIAFFLGRTWISQFAYRYEMTATIFLLPLLIIFALVTIVIIIQSFKVLRDNPVDNLKEK